MNPPDAFEPPVSAQLTSTLGAGTHAGAAGSETLLALMYDELRGLAKHRLGRLPPGQTLQATALVHEAYLRVAKGQAEEWSGRNHFFASAARAMRNILVEQARRKGAAKRGGDQRRERAPDPDELTFEAGGGDVLAVDEALDALEALYPRMAQIVQLRFFAGLEMTEVATVLDISLSTVERDWRFARVWLEERIEDA